jgi:hypothetical protein
VLPDAASDELDDAEEQQEEEQLKRAIPARMRKRLMQGSFESGEDIAAL